MAGASTTNALMSMGAATGDKTQVLINNIGNCHDLMLVTPARCHSGRGRWTRRGNQTGSIAPNGWELTAKTRAADIKVARAGSAGQSPSPMF